MDAPIFGIKKDGKVTIGVIHEKAEYSTFHVRFQHGAARMWLGLGLGLDLLVLKVQMPMTMPRRICTDMQLRVRVGVRVGTMLPLVCTPEVSCDGL